MLDYRRSPIECLAVVASALLFFAVPAQAQDAHGAIAFGWADQERDRGLRGSPGTMEVGTKR